MADLSLEHVSRPPEASTDGNEPAVILLHGRGADERDLLPIAEQLPDALHVVSVRAPEPLGGGYTWYELDLSSGGLHASQPDATEFRRSLDLLAAFVDEAVDAYDLDPGEVGLLGFSQGAVTSLATLAERPRHPWVVALNGYLPASHADPEALSGAAGTPVFLAAGEHDQVIPPRRAREAAETLRAAGLDVTFETYRIGHGTTPGEIRDVATWVRDQVP